MESFAQVSLDSATSRTALPSIAGHAPKVHLPILAAKILQKEVHGPAFFLLPGGLHHPGCPGTLTPLQTQVLVPSFAGVRLPSIRDLYCLTHS